MSKLRPKILTAPWGLSAVWADICLPHSFIFSLSVSSYKLNFCMNEGGEENNYLNGRKTSSQTLQYPDRFAMKEFLSVLERSPKHMKWNCWISLHRHRQGWRQRHSFRQKNKQTLLEPRWSLSHHFEAKLKEKLRSFSLVVSHLDDA